MNFKTFILYILGVANFGFLEKRSAKNVTKYLDL